MEQDDVGGGAAEPPHLYILLPTCAPSAAHCTAPPPLRWTKRRPNDEYGAVYHVVREGADSVFGALAVRLFEDETHHRVVRRSVVNHVVNNWTTYAPLTGYADQDAYRRHMGQDGVRGGAAELRAAGEAFYRTVAVVQDGVLELHVTNDDSDPVVLRRTGRSPEEHYDACIALPPTGWGGGAEDIARLGALKLVESRTNREAPAPTALSSELEEAQPQSAPPPVARDEGHLLTPHLLGTGQQPALENEGLQDGQGEPEPEIHGQEQGMGTHTVWIKEEVDVGDVLVKEEPVDMLSEGPVAGTDMLSEGTVAGTDMLSEGPVSGTDMLSEGPVSGTDMLSEGPVAGTDMLSGLSETAGNGRGLSVPLPPGIYQTDEFGAVYKSVRKDGNCLFRALADRLFGSEEHHIRVRGPVVEHVLLNWQSTYKSLLPSTTAYAYRICMELAGIRGRAAEARAAGEAFKRTVAILEGGVLQVLTLWHDPDPIVLRRIGPADAEHYDVCVVLPRAGWSGGDADLRAVMKQAEGGPAVAPPADTAGHAAVPGEPQGVFGIGPDVLVGAEVLRAAAPAAETPQKARGRVRTAKKTAEKTADHPGDLQRPQGVFGICPCVLLPVKDEPLEAHPQSGDVRREETAETPEERQARLKKKWEVHRSNRRRELRANETPEERAARAQRAREKYARLREESKSTTESDVVAETTYERMRRRAREREAKRRRERRENETPEQREAREARQARKNEADEARRRSRVANLTPEEREARAQRAREKYALSREESNSTTESDVVAETPYERMRRRKRERDVQRRRELRENETPEQREAREARQARRNEADEARRRLRVANETPEEREARLKRKREVMLRLRLEREARETPEQREERVMKRREAVRRRRQAQKSGASEERGETSSEQSEQVEAWLEHRSVLQRQRRARETPEQREARLQQNRQAKRERRQRETPEEREERLQKRRQAKRERRERETPEEREARLQKKRESQAIALRNETPEKRQHRLNLLYGYQRKRLLNETPEEREHRLKLIREYQRKYYHRRRNAKQRASRLKTLAEQDRGRRTNESPEERERRLIHHRAWRRQAQAGETPEERRERQRKGRMRMARHRMKRRSEVKEEPLEGAAEEPAAGAEEVGVGEQ